MNDNDNRQLSSDRSNSLDQSLSILFCNSVWRRNNNLCFTNVHDYYLQFIKVFSKKKKKQRNVLHIGSFLENERYLPQTFFISSWAQAVKASWWIANVPADKPRAVWTPWGSSQITPVWHIVRQKERTSSWKSTLHDSTIRSGTESAKLKPYGCSFIVSHPTWSYYLFKKRLCLRSACHRECKLWRKQSTFYFKLCFESSCKND